MNHLKREFIAGMCTVLCSSQGGKSPAATSQLFVNGSGLNWSPTNDHDHSITCDLFGSKFQHDLRALYPVRLRPYANNASYKAISF